MRTHKAYENMSYCKLNHYHKTVFIPSDVKDIMLVAYVICGWEVHFYF